MIRRHFSRTLNAVDAEFTIKFLDSFETIFTANNAEKVINLAGEILEVNGGFLFESYRMEAPKNWRIG
jgi:hypothetical protein